MRRFQIALAAFLAITTPVLAGGTITNGNASLQFVGIPVFSSGLGDTNLLTDTGAPDQLYKYTWYYRTQIGTNRLFSALDTPSESYSGNTATITYTNAGDGPSGQNRFNAILTVVLTDGAVANQVVVQSTLQFQAHPNNTTTQTFQLFNLVDLDLKGGGVNPGTDDSISITNPSAVKARQTEPSSSDFAEILGVAASRYEVNTGTTLRGKLNSGGADLGNLVGPSSGDVAAAHQWTLALQPGETRTLQSIFTIDRPATTCALPGDMNGDGAVRGDDIAGFVACVLGQSTNCACADVNTDGAINAGDAGALVTALLAP